ncbi:MAG TPA: carboxypeptidase-like regulatory domain-containing protein [Candidatus Binatia bacterium]|jgi:hypothetical protein|nr:carboxypeptidase-like regulatory domain-containing protein [Candidatus Binatia bacterium]
MALLLVEPTRCAGPPPVTGQAAELPPALGITEGKTAQGFPYLFGGISSNEREAMKERAKAKGYNVKLIFAEKSGPFIAGVTVVIADAKGAEMASVETDGPWFYIELPPGAYSLKATFKGQTREIRRRSVPKNKTVEQTFVWDLGEGREP